MLQLLTSSGNIFLLQLVQLQFLQSELKMIYIGLEGMTNSVRLGSEAVQAE